MVDDAVGRLAEGAIIAFFAVTAAVPVQPLVAAPVSAERAGEAIGAIVPLRAFCADGAGPPIVAGADVEALSMEGAGGAVELAVAAELAKGATVAVLAGPVWVTPAAACCPISARPMETFCT